MVQVPSYLVHPTGSRTLNRASFGCFQPKAESDKSTSNAGVFGCRFPEDPRTTERKQGSQLTSEC